MRRALLSLLATTCLIGTPALAQEATTPAPYDWTGFYIGVFGGAAFGDINVDASGVFIEEEFEVEYSNFSVHDENFVGGLQGGFDWQYRNFLFGVVGDVMTTQIEGSEDFQFVYLNGSNNEYYGEAEASLEWLATLRARLGYTTGSLLFFVTGGVAWGEIDARVGFNEGIYGERSGGFCDFWDYCDEDSDGVFGYAVGGGVAAYLSRRMFAELTYLYVNLDDADFDFDLSDEEERVLGKADADFDAHLLRFALNWRF